MGWPIVPGSQDEERAYRTTGAATNKLLKTGVPVEKATKAVISANFGVSGERTFNNLRANFVVETPRKEFFNSHSAVPP
jgi:hypothetical protein